MTDEPTNSQPNTPAEVPPASPAPLGANTPFAMPIFPGMPGMSGILAQVATQNIQVWQGQFPPPEVVERYEVLSPGTFGRLVSMAERTQETQITANTEARHFQRNDIRRAHYLGFAVAGVAIVAALICVYLKQPWVAAACLGVPVLSVANALVESARAPRPTTELSPAPNEAKPPVA